MSTWICPQDGTENPQAEKRCLVCRHPNIPRVIVLVSPVTGQSAEFTESVKFGRAVFSQRFTDPDAKYASDLQFEIIRDLDRVAWVVRPFADTVNPTCYNGKPVDPDGVEISDGGIISVSKSKMKLTVKFKKN
jgi:hypothetical protein